MTTRAQPARPPGSFGARTRVRSWAWAWACAWACAWVWQLAGCEARERPPDMLLYVVDTLRADTLAPYGNPVAPTPAAARLAEEGVLYETVYAHSSWTRPSITSILTGRLPREHGVESRHDSAPVALHFLAERLSEAGYTTGAIVTNPNVGSFFGFDQGYESFIELFTEKRTGGVVPSKSDRARSDEVTRRAIEWIEGAERPFFLFVLTTDPHDPYEPPAGFDGLDARDDRRPKGPRYEPQVSPMLRGNPRLRSVEDARSKYYGEVAFNDRSFGRLLDHLRATGRYDDTLVVLTADHGEEFGEHGHLKHGRTLFDEQVRVPLIIRRPREPEPGRREATPVQLVDLYPTLLAAAGLPLPEGLPGIPLPPDPAAVARTVHARLELDGYSAEMLLVPPWKWIVSRAQPELEKRQLGGLFDIEADPFESKDLATERPEVVAELRARLPDAAGARPGDLGPEHEGARELPDEVRDALEVLGYLPPESR